MARALRTRFSILFGHRGNPTFPTTYSEANLALQKAVLLDGLLLTHRAILDVFYVKIANFTNNDVGYMTKVLVVASTPLGAPGLLNHSAWLDPTRSWSWWTDAICTATWFVIKFDMRPVLKLCITTPNALLGVFVVLCKV